MNKNRLMTRMAFNSGKGDRKEHSQESIAEGVNVVTTVLVM